jgi:hypothetical protein
MDRDILQFYEQGIMEVLAVVVFFCNNHLFDNTASTGTKEKCCGKKEV